MSNMALLFPGQGSQHQGMGKFLYEEFSIAREVFEEASESISVDMKKLCFEGDEKTLSLTENTQPALLTVSVATYKVLKEIRDLSVAAGAGHSVGEYAALVAAGVINLSDGVSLVRNRGKFMQEAVPVGEGGMLAVIGMTPEQVNKLCKWAEDEGGLSPVEPANYNSPEQIVISGNADLIEWIRKNFKADDFGISGKVRMIPLKVSAPFHCSMMKPAEEKMALLLNNTTFSPSQWPIVQNVTAKIHSDTNEIKKNIKEQISGAVRWTQSMEEIIQLKPKAYIECGCGKVLTGLLKKIDSDIDRAFNINSLEELKTIEKL